MRRTKTRILFAMTLQGGNLLTIVLGKPIYSSLQIFAMQQLYKNYLQNFMIKTSYKSRIS